MKEVRFPEPRVVAGTKHHGFACSVYFQGELMKESGSWALQSEEPWVQFWFHLSTVDGTDSGQVVSFPGPCSPDL